jgi:cell division septation protein DedD
VFIFLCGVLVGRNLRDGEGGPTGPFVASASQAQADPSAEAQAQPADPPTPADTVDDLTYHRRLQGEDAEPPRREPEAQTPAPVEPPAPAPAPAKTPATAVAQPPAADTVPADVPANGRPGRFIVQVFASPNGQAAASVVRQLAAKGYPAFLVRPAASAKPAMFRVQVGRFQDRTEAESVSRRLEKEEQFKPWISSR